MASVAAGEEGEVVSAAARFNGRSGGSVRGGLEEVGVGLGAEQRVGAPQHLSGELEPGYDPHMNQILRGVPNDLITRRFDPERYQVWAFMGCTTRHYLDELRTLVAGKRTDNLDLIVSTRPLYWSDSGYYPLAIIRGLLRGQSVNEITAAMCDQAVATEKSLGIAKTGDAFFADGFGDNAPGWRA